MLSERRYEAARMGMVRQWATEIEPGLAAHPTLRKTMVTKATLAVGAITWPLPCIGAFA